MDGRTDIVRRALKRTSYYSYTHSLYKLTVDRTQRSRPKSKDERMLMNVEARLVMYN